MARARGWLRPGIAFAALAALLAAAPGRAADLGRFQAAGPNFVAYGYNSLQDPEEHDALVQFGFRTSIDLSELPDRPDGCTDGAWWFEYRQRFLFEVRDDSAPIHHTDYMPSVYYEWPGCPDTGPAWYGLHAAGWRHRSNGRDAVDSRSWDTAFAEFRFVGGDAGRYLLRLRPRLTLNRSDNNRAVDDYLGNLEIGLARRWGPRTVLELTATKGTSDDHGSYVVELTAPTILGLGRTDVSPYGLAWYARAHDGYGENIIDFDRRGTTLRLGLRLDLR